ncbi:hypothetical protein [Jannaschia sp. R86511]|uniref:hypothetical protein n=1 Tax=Jannaschia sp. R86511 TaxID=3093853 RepID=UPI0036D3E083
MRTGWHEASHRPGEGRHARDPAVLGRDRSRLMDGRVIAGRTLACAAVGLGGAFAVSMVPLSGLVAISVLAVPAAVATSTTARVRAAALTLGIPFFAGTAAGVAVMMLAVIGFTAALGLSGLAVGVAALVGGLLLCRPRGERNADGGATTADASAPGGNPVPAHSQPPAHHDPLGRLRDPRDLTDTELCEAWRVSYLRAHPPGSVPEQRT